MIVREQRSVGLTGLSTLIVHVPKVWARSVGLTKGDKVTVVSGVGDLLLIVPNGREAEAGRLIAAARRML
jgi:phosphate uptake regulator